MKEYKIDWNKVKTIKDIKRILEVLDMTFIGSVEGLENIADLIEEVKYYDEEEIPKTKWEA